MNVFANTCFLLVLSAIGAFGATDNGLMALLPSASNVISSIDVERARSSPFGRFVMARMNSEDLNFRAFVDATGFDPRRDLQYMVFGISGSGDEHKRFALLLRGNFDQDRIQAAVQSRSTRAMSVDGIEIYLDNKNPNETGFAFPELGVAAIGDIASLREVISNRANPSTLAARTQEFITLVSRENDAWFVSMSPPRFVAHELQQDLTPSPIKTQMFQSVRECSGGVQFGDNLRLSFDAVTRSEKDAASLADVLRFFASSIEMQQSKDARARILAPALSGMSLSTHGDTVHASLELTEQNLEQLAQLGPRTQRAR